MVAALRGRRGMLSEALVEWGTASLRVRAPTTVLTYWYTAVSMVLGSAKQLTMEQRSWYQGVVALYGTTAWYSRTEPMNLEEARELVESPAAPLWLRVWMDVSWHAVGRAADLEYLTMQDIIVTGDQVTIFFMFLKNRQDGSLGAVKTLKLWRMGELRSYLAEQDASAQVFPYGAQEVNRALKIYMSRKVTTRAVRRGGAQLLTAGEMEPETIARLMAHQSEATQRTYTQAANRALVMRDMPAQDVLSGIGRAGAQLGTPEVRRTSTNTRPRSTTSDTETARGDGEGSGTRASEGAQRRRSVATPRHRGEAEQEQMERTASLAMMNAQVICDEDSDVWY